MLFLATHTDPLVYMVARRNSVLTPMVALQENVSERRRMGLCMKGGDKTNSVLRNKNQTVKHYKVVPF